jgi:hypothetical protein
MMNSIPEGASLLLSAKIPSEYQEFLQVNDGANFGWIITFSSKKVGESQYLADEREGVLVRLGREAWFCFGMVIEDPLSISRMDGAVWVFPDAGVLWWQSAVFERLADSLGAFLEDYAFGEKYLNFTGVSEDDQWIRLLRRIGRNLGS